MEHQWTIPPTDPQRRDQIPPTVGHHGPTFQPDMPTHQQGEGATTQNYSYPRCFEEQRVQARPGIRYPVEQQNLRHFGNADIGADTQYLNQVQNVGNRVDPSDDDMIVDDQIWTRQTDGIQDNSSNAPVHERAGPSNVGLARALTGDLSIAESRRALARHYINDPDAYVSTIRVEPGPSGEAEVIITLEKAKVF